MKASIELSLYPLSEDYKSRIIHFINRLKQNHPNVDIRVNGMSTQIFGDFEVLMDLLKNELKVELEKHRTMAVLKIGDGELKPENVSNEII